MKAYIANVVIIADEYDKDNVINCLEEAYDQIYPSVVNMQEYDIGEWHDDHPLNKKGGQEKFFTEKSGSAYLRGVADGALAQRTEIIEFLKKTRDTSETTYAHDDLDYVISILEQMSNSEKDKE